MASRLRLLLLKAPAVALALAAALPAAAQQTPQAIEPQLERRRVSQDAIDTENVEVGAFVGVLSIEDFGVNAVYGARLAYHISEGLFVEAAFAQSEAGETSFEALSGNVRLLTDDQRQLTYYNLSLGYNLLPGEAFVGGYAFNSALYVIGGIGSTEFAEDSHFTLNFGVGYRLLATDWLALHVDFRDHVFDSDLLGSDKTTHNLELTGGLTAFF